MRLAFAGLVPRIDLGLNFVALFQQRSIARCNIAQDLGQPAPKSVRLNARARQRFFAHKIIELLVNTKTCNGNLRHDQTPACGPKARCGGP